MFEHDVIRVTETGARICKVSDEALAELIAGKNGGKKLGDIYPYKQLEVGQSIVFDDNDATQRRHCSTLRIYTINFSKKSGRVFKWRKLDGGVVELVRVK